MGRKIRFFNPPFALTFYDRLRQPHQLSTPTITVSITDELRRHFQCNICFELLTETMVTPCLHRFCKYCINKWFATIVGPEEGYQLAKNCPNCKKAIPTVRHLKADQTTDAFIQLLFPNGDEDTTDIEEGTRARNQGRMGATPGSSRNNQRKRQQPKRGSRLGVTSTGKLLYPMSTVQYRADHNGQAGNDTVEPPILPSHQEAFNIQHDHDYNHNYYHNHNHNYDVQVIGTFKSEIYLSSSESDTEEEGPINVPRVNFNSTPKQSGGKLVSSRPLTTTIEPALDSSSEDSSSDDSSSEDAFDNDEQNEANKAKEEEFNIQDDQEDDVQLNDANNSEIYLSSSDSDTEEEVPVNVPRDNLNSTLEPSERPTSSPPRKTTIEPVLDSPPELFESNDNGFQSNAERCQEEVKAQNNQDGHVPLIGQSNSELNHSSSESDSEEEDRISVARNSGACRRSNRLKLGSSLPTQSKRKKRSRKRFTVPRKRRNSMNTTPIQHVARTSQSLALKLAHAITEEAINNQPEEETQEEPDLVENSEEKESKDEENVIDVDSDDSGDYANYLNWEPDITEDITEKSTVSTQYKIPRVSSNTGDILGQIENLPNTEKSPTVNDSGYQEDLPSNEPETQSKDTRPKDGSYRIPKISCPSPVTPPPITEYPANSYQSSRRIRATEQEENSLYVTHESRSHRSRRYETERYSNRPRTPPARSHHTTSRRTTYREPSNYRERNRSSINQPSTDSRVEYYHRHRREILDSPPRVTRRRSPQPRGSERSRSPRPTVNQSTGGNGGKLSERAISSFQAPQPLTATALQDSNYGNSVVWSGVLSLETPSGRIAVPVLASPMTKHSSFQLWFQDATIARQGLHISNLIDEALARQSIRSASNFAIVHLWPSNGNGGEQFSLNFKSVFKYLISNTALQAGFVELCGQQFVHQMFIVPMAGCAPLPPFLVDLLGPLGVAGVPKPYERPDMLLGIMVRRQEMGNTFFNSTQPQQQPVYQTISHQPSQMSPWPSTPSTLQPSFTLRAAAPQTGNYQAQQNMHNVRPASFYHPPWNVPPQSSTHQSVPGVSFTPQQMPYQAQNLSSQAPWLGYSSAPVDLGSSIRPSSAFGEWPRTSYAPVQGFPVHQRPSGHFYHQQQRPYQENPHYDHQMHRH